MIWTDYYANQVMFQHGGAEWKEWSEKLNRARRYRRRTKAISKEVGFLAAEIAEVTTEATRAVVCRPPRWPASASKRHSDTCRSSVPSTGCKSPSSRLPMIKTSFKPANPNQLNRNGTLGTSPILKPIPIRLS